MKTDLFQSCGHCWVFQMCWHIECSTFTASSLSIWNSSAGIPSPPLALFVMMLPKAHLTLQSRMSGSWWVNTLSCLPGSLRSFLYSSVCSCHLFLISSASIRSILFLSLIVLIFAWRVLLISLIFLTNRFKQLDMIEFLKNYEWSFVTLYSRWWSKPSPRKMNAKRQNCCLRRPYK